MNSYALAVALVLALVVNAAPVPRHRAPAPIARDDLVGNWTWTITTPSYAVALCRDGHYSARCIGDVGARWVGRWELVEGVLVILETPIDYPELPPTEYRFPVSRSRRGELIVAGERGRLSR